MNKNLLTEKKPSKPKNIKEALRMMDIVISEEELKEEIRTKTEDEIGGKYHHSLGRWIRNNWNLWDENSDLHQWFKKRGIFHADDMSGIIMNSYSRKLKKQPIKLEEQIQHYKDYWKKNKT